jgi:ATP-dependent exoDNAse (exonuclease V) beta subunit
MFNHIGVDIPEVKTKNVNRKRFYLTPDGGIFPSITTVLSVRKKEGLAEWRKRVGEDVANYIARTAAHRGTKVHKMVEDFLNNHEVEKDNREFLPFCLFQQLKPILTEKVNNIYAQECGLWSDKYKVAGRVDCIAEYDGVPSIIDFKTSRSSRNDDYNLDYYIQASAYAEMFEERTGTPIEQIVILCVTEDGEVQEFVKKKHEYLPLLVETVEQFVSEWERENDEQIGATTTNSDAGFASSS